MKNKKKIRSVINKFSRSRFRQKPKEARSSEFFVLECGTNLKNLKELAQALENMEEHIFKHHVNEYRNDFSTWVGAVLQEEEFAEEMKMYRNKDALEKKILRHLVCKYL